MAEQRKIDGSLALNTASRVITIPAMEYVYKRHEYSFFSNE